MTEAAKPSINYKPNSHTAKKAAEASNEPKKVEKIVTGEVVQRKKPLIRRVVESFAGEDVHDVGTYLALEVVVPTIKTLLSDMASQGVERLLFGEASPRRGSGRRINYSGMYTGGTRITSGGGSSINEPRTISRRGRATHDFTEIVLADRGEAQDVVDRLSEYIDQYDVVSVGTLYQMVGIVGSFQDDKWGWADLAGTRIVRVREGFLIDLPRPMELD